MFDVIATERCWGNTQIPEIRFCPASAVRTYPLESRRDLHSLLLQNVAVINHGSAPLKVDNIDIELLQSNRVVESRKLDRGAVQRIADRGAHLQPDSVRVHVGDQVKAGDVIGKLGSSGNSTEPHLHFHVCDKPDPLMCAGIPVNFRNVTIQWADLPRPIQSGDVVIAK